MGIFEGVLILRFFIQTVSVGSNFAKIDKSKIKKNYDFSFILSHSNKGIKHPEDFDKKKSNVNTWVVL